MQDHHYFQDPAVDEAVLRYDVIVDNVWDYTFSEYSRKMVPHQNRVGGFAKESKTQLVEEHFKPYKVYWRTQKQYWDEYDNQNAWR